MRKAGDLLASFLDGEVLKRAQGYSDLTSSWKAIAGENIAAHSRIIELERSVLMVEADHPGWIQILQTKQKQLLNAVCRRYPDLLIAGISFRLARDPAAFMSEVVGADPLREAVSLTEVEVVSGTEAVSDTADPFAHITDEAFKETLIRLGKGEKLKQKR
ncbi:hypothetical protein FACS189483_05850 [Spirochaetia bacterium]|nr:hypothetical protein FACS189483_05850 [Spirochaetia bacterium]